MRDIHLRMPQSCIQSQTTSNQLESFAKNFCRIFGKPPWNSGHIPCRTRNFSHKTFAFSRKFIKKIKNFYRGDYLLIVGNSFNPERTLLLHGVYSVELGNGTSKICDAHDKIQRLLKKCLQSIKTRSFVSQVFTTAAKAQGAHTQPNPSLNFCRFFGKPSLWQLTIFAA